MSLNWREIDAVLAELDLEGAFIQQVVQPSFDSLALYTYKAFPAQARAAKTVLINLGAGTCRIHETMRRVPKNEKPLRFMEFLKAHIRGCSVARCRQIGTERIVVMDLERAGAPLYRLYIRLWSNAANVLLCDMNGIVLDAFYRRPSKGEVTGAVFRVPESDAKISEKARSLQIRDFHELAVNGHAMSLSENFDVWYGDYAVTASRRALLEQAEKLFTVRITKMEGALERLEEKRRTFLHKEQWKHQGDLILSNAHLQTGTSGFLECPDYETGGTVRIKIDSQKSAPENAAAYYSRYKKAATGLADLEEDIKRAQVQIDAARLEWQKIESEQNPHRIEQMLRRQATPAQQLEKLRPGLAFEVNGWLILVGRNATENDELLRRHARGQDMWFHTRDVVGGFVFVKNRPGKTIPLDVMLAAGNLGVYFSKARQNREADLYYTQVKHLHRAKNGPRGLVLPAQEKNLFIRLDKDVLHTLGL